MAIWSSLVLPRGYVVALKALFHRIEQAELGLISAGVAFFGFLALFPAVAVVIALWGAVQDPTVIEAQLDLLRPVLPPDALSLVRTQIHALLSVSGAPLGWATVFSTLFALWSARAGVAALIRGLNAIHRRPNRAGGHHQLRALLLTLALIGLALCAMVVTVVAPLVLAALDLPGDEVIFLHKANLVLGLVLVVISISFAYRFGPNHLVKPRLFTPGLWIAVALWALASRGFMLYLANFPSYNKVYGTIGAVAILMIWLWVSAYAVLLGAAVDAEVNRHRQ